MSFAFFPALFGVADARATELGNPQEEELTELPPVLRGLPGPGTHCTRRSRREAALAGAMKTVPALENWAPHGAPSLPGRREVVACGVSGTRWAAPESRSLGLKFQTSSPLGTDVPVSRSGFRGVRPCLLGSCSSPHRLSPLPRSPSAPECRSAGCGEGHARHPETDVWTSL